MSYIKGDKFILEIAEVLDNLDKKLYLMKNFVALDENCLQKLPRIRETTEEAYNRGYYDGSHKGFSLTKDAIENARAEGAEEAWEFVLATDEWDEDIRCYDTYAEAKAEFKKWKAGQMYEVAPTSADVEAVKHGRWIVAEQYSKQTFDECKCSACGCVEYFNKGWKYFNYCPNCGARMDGGEQDG